MSKLINTLVECIWLDAWADATAEVTLKDVKDTHKPWLIKTVGWLLCDDEEGISIANEKTSEESFRGRSFILRGMVKSVKPFKAPRQRRVKKDEPTTKTL